MPNLISPHLGNSFAKGKSIQMSALLASAPQLDNKRLDQIAALPLGGRIKLDPWTRSSGTGQGKTCGAHFGARKNALRAHAILPLPHEVSTPSGEKAALDHAGPK